MRQTSGTFGPVFLRKNDPYLPVYIGLGLSVNESIIRPSHTIEFGSRKWGIHVKNDVFLKRSNRGHQMFFGVLSTIIMIMP